MLGDYCSKPLPEVRVVRIGDVEQYQIAEGAIGDLGTTTAIHGHVLRRFAPRFRDGYELHETLGTLGGRAASDKAASDKQSNANSTPMGAPLLDQR